MVTSVAAELTYTRWQINWWLTIQWKIFELVGCLEHLHADAMEFEMFDYVYE